MSGFEVLDVDAHVDAVLRGDAALRALFPRGAVVLSADFAEREPPPFYLVFSMLSEHDVNAVGGYRAMAAPSYQLEGVGRGVGMDVLRPVMTRADALLTAEDAGQVVNGTYVGRFVRTNVMKRSQSVDNVRWLFLTGVYDLVAFSVQ